MNKAIDFATVTRLTREWKDSFLEDMVDWSIDWCRFDEESQSLIITGRYIYGYSSRLE
jgi:hypothetical protein